MYFLFVGVGRLYVDFFLRCIIFCGSFELSCLSISWSLSGGKAAKKAFEFGKTYVVRPKGKHQATVVWLHGLGDNGSRFSSFFLFFSSFV